MRIGNLLRDARERRCMGVREMARIIGLSHSTLSRIENGKRCDGKTMAKLMIWLFTEPAAERAKGRP